MEHDAQRASWSKKKTVYGTYLCTEMLRRCCHQMWHTRNNVIEDEQPDGNADKRTLSIEYRKHCIWVCVW